MAQSPQSLNALYMDALSSVTGTPENWLGFLESAGRNYRYSFPEQLLIHRQKPNATAVLEIQQWNNRFGRWVNRGATGIAVFDRSHRQTRVKYYFDISDTHPGRNASPVPLWSREDQDTGVLLNLLQREYRTEAAVLPYAVFEAAQNCTSAVIDLRWNEIQLVEMPVPQDVFQQLLHNSVSFLLLHRLDLSDYAHFYPQDFDALEHFQSPETITLLGDMVNNISSIMLTEIARTVRQNHLNGPTFFAQQNEIRYDEATRNPPTPNQGGQDYGDELQNREQLSASHRDRNTGAEGTGKVRPAEGILPEGTSEQPLSDAADQRAAEPAPDGDSVLRTGDDEQPAAEAPEASGRDGGIEIPESLGMDGADEQSQTQRRGDHLAGDRVQLTEETPPVQLNIFGDPEPEPSADAPGSFVISQAEIDAELRSGSGFAGSRGRIYAFYQNYSTKSEAIAFLKKEYGIGGHSHTFLDGSHGFVEYEPSKGMTMRHYPTKTELRLRWSAIEDRIRLMVRENTYLSPEEVLEWEKNHLEELPDDLEEPEELEPEVIISTEEPEEVTIIPAENFHITDDALGCGSVRQKFQANLAAIRLLKELEAENRNATAEEQETLSRYVGWGGMPQVFDPENHAWETEYAQLKKALENFEYTEARSSVLNAHYTSPTVIRAIYEAVGNLGFTSGNILEPACGVGNFFGLLPETMQDSKLYGVELDSISGRIAKKLYPQADITVAGFETTDRRNFYDLAIGNVPFGQYRVNDKAYNSLGFNIHNYFFAKAIDQVRPGGIVAFVTSRYTMDAQGQEVRKYIAERAELLGAIRLPNNAFLANAGTQVVSDILFLQKRERAIVSEPSWLYLGKTEEGLAINSYFLDHPEMVLGELSAESTQYGREECTVRPIPGADLGQQLHAAVQHIQGQYLAAELDADVELDDSIPADPEVKNFSFTLVDEKIYYRENSRMKPVSLSASAEQRVRRLMELRDCVRQLISYETEDFPEADIQRQQAELNRLYDAFQAKYGIINSKANRQAFSEDDSYYLLCSLEILDDEQNFQRKADIFTKRTIRPRATVSKVETAQEALVYCLNDRARVDMPFMAALTGKPQEVLEQELSGQIFRLPPSAVDNPVFVLSEEYLSGNVREKLAEAKAAAAENPIYAANVAALEQVQPQDLSAAEISVRLGSTWVPEEDVEQFIYDLLKPAWYLRGKI